MLVSNLKARAIVEYGRRRIEGVRAHLNALHMAKNSLQSQKTEGIEAIRRISRSLRSAVPSSPGSAIRKKLSEIEKARDETVSSCLETLLPRLSEITAQVPPINRVILLVEDDPLVIHLLERQLSSGAREFRIAKTLREALVTLSQKDIALIILDLSLPDGDGRELLIQTRQNPSMQDVPIIVVSSHVGNEVKTECFALGADAYFQKPFDPIALATAIAAKLQRFTDLSLQASLDPVTRLPNRMVFYKSYAQVARLSARTGSPFALAILDLDRFKAVNDLSGHQMGDYVLQTVASLLVRSLRTSDVIARWGGEEFVVLFPDTALPQARFALNKALEVLRGRTFTAPDKKRFRITFSAGLIPVEGGAGVDEAVAVADRYLYLAKKSGRNHVMCHADPVDAHKRNILLVEDDEFMATLVRRYLEKEGLRIFHAKNGKEALVLCSKTMFSLITLDVQLPDTNGFKLLQQFRGHHAARHVPVIMLTSKAAEADVVRGFRLGADDYIVKPFSPAQFLARVNRFLER